MCEFEELHSPLREPSSQGGGVHGNAILSKFDMSEVRARAGMGTGMGMGWLVG